MANQLKPIPTYTSGGDVPKDQVANVDQGERVLNPQEATAYRMAAAGKAPSGLLGRIADRAHELYNQWTAVTKPEDEEAAAFREKQRNVDEAMGKPVETQMKPLAPSAPAPMQPIDPNSRYGTRGAEKRLDPEGNEINPMTPAGMRTLGPQRPVPAGLQSMPSYDGGGDVPEDQTAQLHADEKVLDPNKAEAYRQAEKEVLGGSAAPKEQTSPNENWDRADEKVLDPNKEQTSPAAPEPTEMASAKPPLGDTGAPRSTEMKTLPMQSAPEAPKAPAEEPKAPDPMEMIQHDKLNAMQKGTAGLSDLGTSLIHEKLLGGKAAPEAAAPVGPALTPETPEMPAYTGMQRLGKGTPGEAEAHKQFEEKKQDYDTRIQAALDSGTPEGEREAASLQLAKSHFEKMNPLGSPANKPGLLGKIEHGLAKAGNIAGNIVAPGTMALIPGTDLNKKFTEADLRSQEKAATHENLEEAQARQANIGSKLPPTTQVFDDLKGQLNPETGKVYTDPERLELAQNPGKAGEVTYARKYMKEHPGSTYTDAAAEYHKMLAGTKPLNEMEKRVADRLATQHLEDTPQNRDAARKQIISEDVTSKQQAALPFSEQKAKFNDILSTTRALLVQQNADANSRGLEADKLQNTENARNSAVTSKIQTAKDALNASDNEQFSAQIVPITSLLAVTSAEGVKRVNKQELDKFVPASGSFGRWIDAHADQFLEGKIPVEYRNEVGHMLDRMTAAETAEHLINTRSIDETVRQGAQQPVQKPEGGAKATPKKSEAKTPAEETKTTPAASAVGGFARWKQEQQKTK